MMLEYFGFKNQAEKLITAVMEALKNKEAQTPDLGGLGNTETFVNEILKILKKLVYKFKRDSTVFLKLLGALVCLIDTLLCLHVR
jgi:hypothetical protein